MQKKTRRKHWITSPREAAEAAFSDAQQQGAHIAFKDGRFKVHRGSHGSGVGELLIYKCRLNRMMYCGFYDRRSLLLEILEDMEFIIEKVNERTQKR